MRAKITKFNQEDIYNGTDSFRIIKQYTNICQQILINNLPHSFNKVDFYCSGCSIDDNFVVSREINGKTKINFLLPEKYNLEEYGLPFVLTIPKAEDVEFLVNGKLYNKK